MATQRSGFAPMAPSAQIRAACGMGCGKTLERLNSCNLEPVTWEGSDPVDDRSSAPATAGVMDVFEAESRSRARSACLVAVWSVLTVALVLPAYAAVWMLAAGWPFETPVPSADLPLWDPTLGIPTAGAVVGAVLMGSTRQLLRLRQGGAAVATLMGGRALADGVGRVHENEGRLRNVAEEVAIAAGLTPPRLFILPAEPGINAFAAGFAPQDAAVVVTAGALERLDRDELQALVAHELAHVAQGDTRLHTLSLALLHGFLFVSLAGAALMGSGFVRRGPRLGLPFLLGVGLTVAGAAGAGLAAFLRAAVGREREFLADALAAQYTRAPLALASVLRKAGGHRGAAEIRHHYRQEVGHLFFAAGGTSLSSRLLRSHPSLSARIRRLDPDWDGSFTYTALPAQSRTARIAEALRAGKRTTIPEDPEWNVATQRTVDGRPFREPGRGLFGRTRSGGQATPDRTPAPPPSRHPTPVPTLRLPPESPSAGAASRPQPVAPADRLHSFVPVQAEIQTILTALAHRAGGDSKQVRQALSHALAHLPGLGESPLPAQEPSPRTEALEAAFTRLSRLSPGAGRRFVEACVFAVHREGTTTAEAAALLRACSIRMGVGLEEILRSS